MTAALTSTTIDQLTRQRREPAWLTELRQRSFGRHTELPWPHPSDDIWRRTDASLLDPARGFALADDGLLQSLRLTDREFAQFTHPLGDEQLFVRANGVNLTEGTLRGVVIDDLGRAAHTDPDPIRHALESHDLSESEQKFASLNLAFHHDDVVLRIPTGFAEVRPVRLVRLFSLGAHQVIFPMTVIFVGAGSTVTLIEEHVGIPGEGSDGAEAAPAIVNSRIELVLAPAARVHYVRLQRWGPTTREFLLQRATLAQDASLTMANVTLGAALSKAHIITKLAETGAATKLFGFVFGHHAQHVDQHTLQDHQAPHTSSDLQYRAALQDQSRLVYTGLIRIAPAAKQTNAFQANRNLLLSRTAKVETIPMLEILADDVQCKHGASVGPIDEEQVFYLQSRGVPRETAQRLIVMGFIEPVLQQVPFEPLQDQLRREIEGGLQPAGAESDSADPVGG